MATRRSGIVLEQIRTLFDEGRIGTMTDEQLLQRFAARRAEADRATEAAELAFEILVLRHGPMVLGVCRRVLRDPHEVEDAFQATFLVLARRAGSIRKPDGLGGWLRKVAHRVASRARALSIRRAELGPPRPVSSMEDPGTIAERDELCIAVLDEIQLLPEKYRVPVQLCYIEGQTHDEAARRLGWPVGTVRTRLAWARERLRTRLTARGLVVPAGFVGASLASLKASAEVPAPLVKATVATASGRAVGAAATSLATNALRAMLMFKFKLSVLLMLATGSLAWVVLPLTQAQVEKTGKNVVGAVEQQKDRRPAGSAVKEQERHATAREVGTVFFRVVDKNTKTALAGVHLKVWINGKMAQQYTTDGSGRMLIQLPQSNFNRLFVTARKDGIIPIKVHLWRDNVPELEIPRSYALAIGGGTAVGGVVRDGDGDPVEGVTVTPYGSGPEDRVREVLDFDGMAALTDHEGRWSIDTIPAGFDLEQVRFAFRHPDFFGSADPNLEPEQLRNRRAVAILHRGVSIAGRVMDEEGRPIVGAAIRRGSESWQPAIKTGENGRFRFPAIGGRETILTVHAADYAPEITTIHLRNGLPPFEVRLGRGRMIRGQVVDSQGRPLAGARVSVSSWKGSQTLDWHTRSDAAGQFAWDHAPKDRITLVAFKEGYRVAYATNEPSDNEALLKLTPAARLRIRGTVTDAETGLPIETFTVVPMVEPGDILLLEAAKTHQNGRYLFSDAHNGQPYRIRIESAGHRPATSPQYPHDAGDQVFDARLDKGHWIEGIVRDLEGAPLAAAEVVLATDNGISIHGGNDYQRRHHPHVLTGADGRFSFSPPDGPYRIVALHDQGYVEASGQQFANGHDLRVQPWSRIEGKLSVGGKPLGFQTVVASFGDEPGHAAEPTVQHDSRAQTDERGRFVIRRVVPGEARLLWQRATTAPRTMPDRYYQPVFVDVVPGQTSHVDVVQEGGCPLVGRVVTVDEKDRPLALVGTSVYLVQKLPKVPYPAGLADADRPEWLSRWRLTEDGKAYRHIRRGIGHGVDLQPDGAFRVDEIQPGAYELHVRVKGFTELTRDATIPEPAAGMGRVPVDLGTLTPKLLAPSDHGR